jgi:hypothetical protein
LPTRVEISAFDFDLKKVLFDESLAVLEQNAVRQVKTESPRAASDRSEF